MNSSKELILRRGTEPKQLSVFQHLIAAPRSSGRQKPRRANQFQVARGWRASLRTLCPLAGSPQQSQADGSQEVGSASGEGIHSL
jgi:hypothetical protein